MKVVACLPEQFLGRGVHQIGFYRYLYPSLSKSMNAYSEKPEAINWNHYRRNISKANLVEDFKKQFEAFTVPLPKDTGTAKIEEQMKKIVNHLATLKKCNRVYVIF